MNAQGAVAVAEIVQSEGNRPLWLFGERPHVQLRVLAGAADQLRDGNRPTVLLAPKTGEDAAHVAMLETVAQLREQGCSIPAFGKVVDRSLPWDKKLEAFSKGLQALNGGTAFLLCNPSVWRSGDDDDFYWNHKTQQLLACLFRNVPHLVYTGNYMEGLPGASKHPFRQDFKAERFLQRCVKVGLLSNSAASAILSRGNPGHFGDLSVRLSVALQVVADSPEQLVQCHPLGELLHSFNDALNNRMWSALRDAWYTISLVRRPFAWNALRSILPQLRNEEEAILTECLMDRDKDGRLELILRPHWELTQRHTQRAHKQCLKLYQRRLGGANETNRWRFGMEAQHHASSAGDWQYIKKQSPLFCDQYNLFGKRASLAAQASDDEETFKLAVHFFEQTLKIDERDDYAHHYLAYNLDYAALDEKRSDKHYRRAIEIAPERPWWHSRYVAFLITVGRTRDARQAWERAQEDLLTVKSTDAKRVYEDFHRWVLRLLLHRSQLDFAADILRDIPEKYRDDIRGIRLMEGMLASMRDAADGRDVYPMDVPLAERWGAPRLLPPSDPNYHLLIRWFVGRVEYKTDRTVGLFLAESPEASDKPRYFRSELSLEQFADFSETKVSAVSEGDYFEFYTFAAADNGKEEKGVIRFARQDPRASWRDDLPPLRPDPRRYLKRADWIKGDSGQTNFA